MNVSRTLFQYTCAAKNCATKTFNAAVPTSASIFNRSGHDAALVVEHLVLPLRDTRRLRLHVAELDLKESTERPGERALLTTT